MIEIFYVFLFLGFCAAISFAYNLGFSQGRKILPERRDGMIVNLIAVGFAFGVALGAFLVRATGVTGKLLHGLFLAGGCVLGTATTLMFGYRFFGEVLKSRSSDL